LKGANSIFVVRPLYFSAFNYAPLTPHCVSGTPTQGHVYDDRYILAILKVALAVVTVITDIQLRVSS